MRGRKDKYNIVYKIGNDCINAYKKRIVTYLQNMKSISL